MTRRSLFGVLTGLAAAALSPFRPVKLPAFEFVQNPRDDGCTVVVQHMTGEQFNGYWRDHHRKMGQIRGAWMYVSLDAHFIDPDRWRIEHRFQRHEGAPIVPVNINDFWWALS